MKKLLTCVVVAGILCVSAGVSADTADYTNTFKTYQGPIPFKPVAVMSYGQVVPRVIGYRETSQVYINFETCELVMDGKRFDNAECGTEGAYRSLTVLTVMDLNNWMWGRASVYKFDNAFSYLNATITHTRSSIVDILSARIDLNSPKYFGK